MKGDGGKWSAILTRMGARAMPLSANPQHTFRPVKLLRESAARELSPTEVFFRLASVAACTRAIYVRCVCALRAPDITLRSGAHKGLMLGIALG